LRSGMYRKVLSFALAVVVGLLLLAPVHAHDSGGWESDCGLCSLAKVGPIPASTLELPRPAHTAYHSTPVRVAPAPCAAQPTPFEARAPPARLN